jgi:pyruvate kinase
MKKPFNRTKIVATMGPATADIEVLEEMYREGLDICRINFSHGDYDAVLKTVENIRTLNEKLKRHVGILADLQGPKLRIGVVQNNSAELVTGQIIDITTKEMEGNSTMIYITYPQFPQDVKVGETVLIDDGKILLEVIDTNGKDNVRCLIKVGGHLSSKKGVNLPNTKISLPCMY